MKNNNPLIFGPVNSRRFGISLGIDLSPDFKQCNFDCLYCELKKGKTVSKQSKSLQVDDYIDATKKALMVYPETQVITITANGEPTLYPYLNELVDRLNEIKQNKKLLILSNGGLINDVKIAQILKKIDIVKLSLDCATKECFKKLDRLDDSINYQDIIDGIISFSKIYQKELIIEVLFVDSLNNKQHEIDKIYEILKAINPTRVDIGTIDRPPAYDVKPISFEELQAIAYRFEGLNISIAHRNRIKLNKNLSSKEILNLLNKRPQTVDDIDNLLDDSSKKLFNELLKDNKIITKNQAGVIFYAKR